MAGSGNYRSYNTLFGRKTEWDLTAMPAISSWSHVQVEIGEEKVGIRSAREVRESINCKPIGPFPMNESRAYWISLCFS